MNGKCSERNENSNDRTAITTAMQKQNLMEMKPRAQETLELSVNALRQKK